MPTGIGLAELKCLVNKLVLQRFVTSLSVCQSGGGGGVPPYQLSVPSAAIHGGSTGDISSVGEPIIIIIIIYVFHNQIYTVRVVAKQALGTNVLIINWNIGRT